MLLFPDSCRNGGEPQFGRPGGHECENRHPNAPWLCVLVMREAGTGLKSSWRMQITGAGLGDGLPIRSEPTPPPLTPLQECQYPVFSAVFASRPVTCNSVNLDFLIVFSFSIKSRRRLFFNSTIFRGFPKICAADRSTEKMPEIQSFA